MGTDFNVNMSIKIVALGVFDSGGDGLLGKLHARIYDRDLQTSVAGVEFTTENAGTLFGGSRHLALKNPLILQAGFQGTISVAYLGANQQEPDGNARVSSGNWTVIRTMRLSHLWAWHDLHRQEAATFSQTVWTPAQCQTTSPLEHSFSAR